MHPISPEPDKAAENKTEGFVVSETALRQCPYRTVNSDGNLTEIEPPAGMIFFA